MPWRWRNLWHLSDVCRHEEQTRWGAWTSLEPHPSSLWLWPLASPSGPPLTGPAFFKPRWRKGPYSLYILEKRSEKYTHMFLISFYLILLCLLSFLVFKGGGCLVMNKSRKQSFWRNFLNNKTKHNAYWKVGTARGYSCWVIDMRCGGPQGMLHLNLVT